MMNDARGRLPLRDRAAPWRAWYKLARWRDLRIAVFVRDLYVCQVTGLICAGTYPADDSPVADHIRPHRGDPALFWDPANVQTLAKGYHDREKQLAEQASVHQRGVWY